MRRQRGFTLIELLIVVALIGIIAAIAIPSILYAQRGADRRLLFGRSFDNLSTPLTTAQIELLLPTVEERIAGACGAVVLAEAELPRTARATDPTAIQYELDKMAGRLPPSALPECSRIKHIARDEGFLPMEAR